MSLTTNFVDWMRQLDPALKNISIYYLAIPESFNSLSYSVNRNSPLSPDAPRIAKILNKIYSPLIRWITYNWCITQFLDLKRQFLSRIRYFDLRIATRGFKLFSCHMLCGIDIIDALRNLNEMLEVHSKEVILLDFQNFYEIKHSDHLYLIQKIHHIFERKLCPCPRNVSQLTLNELQIQKIQVIIIYRNLWAKAVLEFWPSWKWVNLWPNTTDITHLRNFLTKTLMKRPDNAGFVSQCIFTPNFSFIMCHLFSTLKKTCATFYNIKIKSSWIENQKCLTSKGVNVIIADFIDLPGFNFCSTVIHLNKKNLSIIT